MEALLKDYEQNNQASAKLHSKLRQEFQELRFLRDEIDQIYHSITTRNHETSRIDLFKRLYEKHVLPSLSSNNKSSEFFLSTNKPTESHFQSFIESPKIISTSNINAPQEIKSSIQIQTERSYHAKPNKNSLLWNKQQSHHKSKMQFFEARTK